ncbi:MAG: T9SS type A sorting domain-containing protein [Chitinophagaceae bacterium]|nr:T9SS type A sorting domain-containing protein [Chitinophagaceae bacterium]
MKKNYLLMLVVTAAISVQAQENPCPTVSGIRKTNVVNNGNGTCTGTISMNILNDVSNSNPKSVRVEVIAGGSTSVAVVDQCFLASTVAGGASYSTAPFTIPCGSVITVRVTRHTASNGVCQGGTCGNTIIIQESPLPVAFASFTARRNGAAVLLNWQTSSEQNNSGFSVERFANGSWQEVGYVASQAQAGNSDAILSYTFTDPNTIKGISQYRIRQVDLDGRSKASDIRIVRGEGVLGKTVIYPNPSLDGKVNVVFEDATTARNVTVVDMTGKVVKQWRGVTGNNLQVENLPAGIYSLRIIAVETGEQTVEKFVINKH